MKKNRPIYFEKVQAHSNLKWNDRADELAKLGANAVCSSGRYSPGSQPTVSSAQCILSTQSSTTHTLHQPEVPAINSNDRAIDSNDRAGHEHSNINYAERLQDTNNNPKSTVVDLTQEGDINDLNESIRTNSMDLSTKRKRLASIVQDVTIKQKKL